MSSIVKTAASVALPIVGNYFLPGIGGLIGGAIGGAINGGGIGGAALGALGGYAGQGLTDNLFGSYGPSALTSGVSSIGDALSSGVDSIGSAFGLGGDAGAAVGDVANVGSVLNGGTDSLGVAGGYAPSAAGGATSLGDGTLGAVSSNGMLTAGTAPAATGSGFTTAGISGGAGASAGAVGGSTGSIAQKLLSPVSGISGILNPILAQSNAQAAQKASQQQQDAITTAEGNMQPYSAVGQQAAAQIQQIQANPSAYIQNNPLYNSLATQAQNNLLANAAAKGKVGSGGTAAALQDNLLQVGNGLVQQQLGTDQQELNSGQAAAGTTAQLQTAGGQAASAGTIGQANAYSQGYNNQIQTLLAMQGLNKTPTYQPTGGLNL